MQKYGIAAGLSLLALRLIIGAHFFHEGATKMGSGEAFTASFLSRAKGPLAPMYQSMIWDRDGRFRLGWSGPGESAEEPAAAGEASAEQFRRDAMASGLVSPEQLAAADEELRAKADSESTAISGEVLAEELVRRKVLSSTVAGLLVDGKLALSVEATFDRWDQFRAAVVERYGLSEEALPQADAILESHREQLVWYLFDEHYDEIVRYFLGLERIEENLRDKSREEVASLWGQSQSIAGELYGKRAAWLRDVDQIWASLAAKLNGLGVASLGEEAKAPRPVELRDLGRRPLDSQALDKVIPWFDMIIGALLVVGLFTRTAATAGGLFLASVVLSQWPGALGAAPTWGQAIEMFGLFAVAGLAAGRIAGLDAILERLQAWCCPPQQGETNESNA